MRLLRVGGEVLPVVARPLLVAERLEALLQPLVVGLVELVGLDPEGLLVDVLHPAAHDVLAERVEELADAFLAVAGGDVLEGGVAEVVDEARIRDVAVLLEARELRDLVRHRGVALSRRNDSIHALGVERLLLVAIHRDRRGVGIGRRRNVARAQQRPEQQCQRDSDEQRGKRPEDEHS